MHNEVEFVTPKTRLRDGADRGKVIGGKIIKLTFVGAHSADPKYVRFKSDAGKVYTFDRTFAERLLKWGESEQRAKAIAAGGATEATKPAAEAPTASQPAPEAPKTNKPRSVRSTKPAAEAPTAS